MKIYVLHFGYLSEYVAPIKVILLPIIKKRDS